MPNLTIIGRAKVRKEVQDALLRNYWDTKGEAIAAIDAALQKHDMFLELTDCSGDEGRTSFRILADKGYQAICNACTKDVAYPSFDNVLAFAWYRMGSGCWEITAYIS